MTINLNLSYNCLDDNRIQKEFQFVTLIIIIIINTPPPASLITITNQLVVSSSTRLTTPTTTCPCFPPDGVSGGG